MQRHLEGVATIKAQMEAYRRPDRPAFGDVSTLNQGVPDAAMLERMKAAGEAADARQAAADAKAAAEAAAPPKPPSEPEGPPADQDPRYSEMTRWALGVAVTARKDLEMLQTNVRVYNSAKRALEDPAHIEMIRGIVDFEESVTAYVERLKEYVAGYGSAAREGAANILQSYNVSGSPLAMDASGFLSITDFTMQKTGPDWNMAVRSTGAAKVIASGVDVSSLVYNGRMSGGLWFAPGQATDVMV